MRSRDARFCCALVLLMLSLLLPSWAWSQGVLRPHLGLLNPLEYGETCTTATLTAAIAAAPAHLGVLMLPPVNRAGTACVWAITSNLTIPSTLVLHVPHGASVTVSSGVTLTLTRYPRIDNTDWITGLGTVTIVEASPSGDITQVWGCTTGDCSALTAASGDSLDAGSADSSKPATRSTTLPATCAEGQEHQDTDSGGTETYICTATNTWVKVMGTTDVATDAQIPHLNTLSTGLTASRIVTTDGSALLASTLIPCAYATNFTSQTTVTVTGATHGCGTQDLAVIIRDNSNPRLELQPQSISVHQTTFDIIVTFSLAQSGRIIVK